MTLSCEARTVTITETNIPPLPVVRGEMAG
jgi:hypothetical protein